jgi:halocyanin-like protein
MSPHTDPTLTRRTVLRGAVGLTATSLAATGATPVAGQESSEPDYGSWFDDVSNYDGTVDERGSSEVTVTVGAEGNNGNYGFGPAAVRVDPGTTVVWEWTGKGNGHNVVAEDGSFESELSTEAGHTFEQTFEEPGVYKYACVPHKMMGMKGAVVVGDPGQTDGGSGGGQPEQSAGPDYGGWFENVGNFEGTTDRTGESEVTVTVGATGNNGSYAFAPPAVRVDPGTTVVWEWSGKGNAHNVVAEDGSFESELTPEAGFTFEQTFEETGVYKYACVPHEPMGMKGAVVVGGSGSGGASGSSGYDFEDLLALGSGLGLVGALFATFALGSRETVRGRDVE